MKNKIEKITKKQLIISVLCLIIIITCLIISLVFKTSNNEEVKESEIQSICELATLKAYYHNVAKDKKSKGTGISGWGEKEREYWVEYEGYATVGIDMDQVSMKINDRKVTITLPHAKVLDTNITSNYDSEDIRIIESGDGFFNKNKVTTEDRINAISEAQDNMKKSVEENKYLLQAAELRAQELIENYIMELGNLSNKNYEIEWEYIENEVK